MDSDSFDERGGMGDGPSIAAAVLFGIALFVAGFAVTMYSHSGAATSEAISQDASETSLSNASGGSGHNAVLMIGLLLSMVGVIVATVVPAVTFIRRANRDA